MRVLPVESCFGSAIDAPETIRWDDLVTTADVDGILSSTEVTIVVEDPMVISFASSLTLCEVDVCDDLSLRFLVRFC